MVELLVVVGVIAIAIGLLLPALEGSVSAARRQRAAAAVQNAARLVELYTGDHAGVYPLSHPEPYFAGRDWHEAVVEAGYIASSREVDAAGFDREGHVTIALSMCMVYDPALMTPRTAVPIQFARSVPVRADQVLFPSDKGMMWNWWIHWGRFNTFWCCDQFRPAGPVAMADGSVHLVRWTDMKSDPPPIPETYMGYPVQSTWDGYRGRDR